MLSSTSVFKLLSLISVAVAVPTGTEAGADRLVSRTDTAKRATCTVNSVASASNLSSCTSVVIEAFTVPAGNTVTIAAAKGASIVQTGDVTFAKTTINGPLFIIDTEDVTYNGGSFQINGNGALYWDGNGTNSGTFKPHPFVKLEGYGTFEDFTVLNSPAQAISVGTTATTIIQKVTVDNSAGDTNSLGHNTDGFDVSASDVTLSNNIVKNQDDCIAVNGGSTILIENMNCSGGHGISIGSVAASHSVSNVNITGNTITNSEYGFRIKVDSDATDASVSGVTYEANTVSGITDYGVLISYGTPGTSAPITQVASRKPGTLVADTDVGAYSNVRFIGGTTSITVDSSAVTLGVDCGDCSGNWDFSSLKITGGQGSKLKLDKATISGGTY